MVLAPSTIDFAAIDKQSESEPLKAIAFYQSVLSSNNEQENKQKDIVIVKLSALYAKTKYVIKYIIIGNVFLIPCQ